MDVIKANVPICITVIFYVLGTCIMLPWNFFITANPYWQYKLRNVSLDGVENATTEITDLQMAFTPTLVIISNVTIFLFGFITSAISSRVKEKIRILCSLAVLFCAISAVFILSFINSDEWQYEFFILTMVLVALINVGVSVLQASSYGMAGQFPPKCMSCLVSGQALAGVISSVSQIISLAIGQENQIITANIYFGIASVFVLITVASYLYLRKTDQYKFIQERNEKEYPNQVKKVTASFSTYLTILDKIKWMAFTLALGLVIVLSVYPAVQVYVTSSHSPSTWADVYFQPVVTFLLFNVVDMIGRETPKWIKWPSHNSWLFHVLAATRIVFIPLMLLCNGTNKTFPTLFYKDFYYIIINTLFAFFAGYFGSLTLVYYPRLVTAEETELAGTLMAALMGVGMVTGSCLSLGFVKLWGPKT